MSEHAAIRLLFTSVAVVLVAWTYFDGEGGRHGLAALVGVILLAWQVRGVRQASGPTTREGSKPQ